MPLRGGAAAGGAPPPPPGRRYVIFRLGTVEYALDAGQVRRSMPAPPVLRADVVFLGQTYPVVDLRTVWGRSRAGGPARLVLLVETTAARAALAVEALADLRSIADAAIVPLPELFQGTERRWLHGLTRLDERVVVVLRLEAILGAHAVRPPSASAPAASAG